MSVASLSNKAIRVTRLGAPSGAAQTRAITVIYNGKARVQPLNGRQRAELGRDLETVTTRAYIAGNVPIDTGDIMHADDDEYLVRAVVDVDLLGRYTTLYCERQR